MLDARERRTPRFGRCAGASSNRLRLARPAKAQNVVPWGWVAAATFVLPSFRSSGRPPRLVEHCAHHRLQPGMQVSVLQLRDPIFANDDGFQTIDAKTVLYVTGIRHRFEVNGRATTEIETT